MDPSITPPVFNLPPITPPGQDQPQLSAPSATEQASANVVNDTAASSSSQGSKSTNPQSSLIADDVDLIEKEWVAQIKHLLAENANDPYELSQQIANLKADYLQKRFNKSVKK